ncbi:nitronate monooxygenase family protein [Niveispirillum sp.]|uniref:NAD(P)H-dependent flavin oxidoreductase n=1 Tax=Niveispirillum sp. TaxID=1917217 RepID=UPI001B5AB566|nr:nitronate monooxygenase [Niveispirillum sp.]MBP7335922.1 nitronate monooxygenase [Niveispirillum sp.]
MTGHRLPGLTLPVMVAPMFLVSGVDLVVAACRAGMVGALPAHNCRTADELDRWLGAIAAALRPGIDAPWAVNLVTHASNSRLPADLAVLHRHRPPIVITALGSPKPVIEAVHAYGGIVLADVVNMTLAAKAVAAGVDGLVCVSAGAGGHTGFLSPFAFIAAARSLTDGILCVGGGIGDGAGVAGAIAAGADLALLGTRFIAAAESLAVPAYKDMVVTSGIDDLVVSAAITGTPASWLKPSLLANGYDPADLNRPVTRDYGGDPAKRWKDLWAAGQGVGGIHAVEPVAEIAVGLRRGYDAAAGRL